MKFIIVSNRYVPFPSNVISEIIIMSTKLIIELIWIYTGSVP